MGRLDVFCIISTALAAVAMPSAAQETDLAGKVAIELNAAQTDDTSCTLTFMIINGLGTQLDKAVYETVLFDKSGQVNRLMLLDFGTLPQGRPRVRQFAVPQLTCDQLGRVLFNGASTCQGEGMAEEVCTSGLSSSSRIGIEVLG